MSIRSRSFTPTLQKKHTHTQSRSPIQILRGLYRPVSVHNNRCLTNTKIQLEEPQSNSGCGFPLSFKQPSDVSAHTANYTRRPNLIPGQSTLALWCTKWHWDKFLSECLHFSIIIIPSMLYTDTSFVYQRPSISLQLTVLLKHVLYMYNFKSRCVRITIVAVGRQ